MNYINNKIFKPSFIIIHFELAFSNAIIRVLNSEIQYCYFHYQQNKKGKRKNILIYLIMKLKIKNF